MLGLISLASCQWLHKLSEGRRADPGGGQFDDQGRSATDRGQYRQAAGAAAAPQQEQNRPHFDWSRAGLGECSRAQEEIMRRLAIPILVAAAAISCSAHDVVLAQATISTQQVSPTLGGLSTPVTSTVTNCMMLCNSQVANCRSGCFVPAPPVPSAAASTTSVPFPTPILNATVNPACTTGCTSVQHCARKPLTVLHATLSHFHDAFRNYLPHGT